MLCLSLLSLSLALVSASPVRRAASDLVSPTDDVLLFDAPAFPDPSNPSNTLVSFQSFVYFRQIDIQPFTSAIETVLKSLGLDVSDKISTIEERIRLFAAVGRAGKTVSVNVKQCGKQAQLPGTSGQPDLGMVTANASVGECLPARELTAQVPIPGIRSATIFSSPNSGFGVISDIDDTVKVSNSLDTLALAKSTLIDDPQPVAGMPELYTSLSKSLNSPQFIYVTGSPYQLYPFLNNFINTAYSESKGPIFLQNLTVTSVQDLFEFANSDGVLEYKVSMVDRIHGMYPNKKFLAIGDSTQKDPETYAEAFRKFGGDFMTCIWIRRVEGADNSPERFAAAFQGVSSDKFKIFTDADIPSLQEIDVAGGGCTE